MASPSEPCCAWRDAAPAAAEAVCCLASVLACLLALRRLAAARASVRRRLFWSQLLVLVILDMLSGLADLVIQIRFLVRPQANVDHFWLLFTVWASLLASSVYMEMHIAAGFAAASYGAVRCTTALRCLMPVGVCFAATMTFVFSYSLDGGSWYWWVSMEAGFSLLAAAFYVMGLISTMGAPAWLRLHAVQRALSYAALFVITDVPLLVGMLRDRRHVFNELSFVLCACNGLFNACVYLYCLRRDASSGDNATNDLEVSILHRYFDLGDTSDESVCGAERAVAMAVAEAHLLRRVDGAEAHGK